MKCFKLELPDDTCRYVEGAWLPRIGDRVELEPPVSSRSKMNRLYIVVNVVHTYGWKLGEEEDIYEETDQVRVLLISA